MCTMNAGDSLAEATSTGRNHQLNEEIHLDMANLNKWFMPAIRERDM